MERPLFDYPRHRAKGEYDGLGYHGPPLNLKEGDPENMLPKKEYKVHIRQFDLNNLEHMQEYEEVCQAVFSGDVLLSYEKIVYVEEISSWRVLMRWAEQFYTTPKNVEQGLPSRPRGTS
jgi:hypothetical protein